MSYATDRCEPPLDPPDDEPPTIAELPLAPACEDCRSRRDGWGCDDCDALPERVELLGES